MREGVFKTRLAFLGFGCVCCLFSCPFAPPASNSFDCGTPASAFQGPDGSKMGSSAARGRMQQGALQIGVGRGRVFFRLGSLFLDLGVFVVCFLVLSGPLRLIF